VISLSASINSRTPETIKEKLEEEVEEEEEEAEEEEEEKNGWLLSHRREFLTCPTMSNGDGWENEKTLVLFLLLFLFYFFGDVVKGSGRQWMDIFDRYGRETSSQIGMHPS
jgi:hypothetical protein